MLQKLQSWLVRQRDQSAVSYSRFGRPGLLLNIENPFKHRTGFWFFRKE